MDHSEVKHLPQVDYTPAQLDEPSKLLLGAADLIEKRGWCQNSYASEDGRLCILGAVKTFAGIRMDDSSMWVDAALIRMASTIHHTAWRWNDQPGRTKEEVVAKLRAVALGL